MTLFFCVRHVALTVLEFRDLPASASQVLESKTRATTARALRHFGHIWRMPFIFSGPLCLWSSSQTVHFYSHAFSSFFSFYIQQIMYFFFKMSIYSCDASESRSWLGLVADPRGETLQNSDSSSAVASLSSLFILFSNS